jgi:ABC-2 type transport system permease protein
MNKVILLLTPGIVGMKNQLFHRSASRIPWKMVFLALLGICFWSGTFWISLRVLVYFSTIEEIGTLLSYKMLSMLITVAFSLLFISAVITCVSRFYLSKDLICVHAMPVPAWQVLLSRWTAAYFDGSWMVLLYLIPVLLSYVLVFDRGGGMFVWMGMAVISLSVTASVLGGIFVILLVRVIPAGRLKSVLVVSGILVFCLLYLAARMIRPEQLVDPETFNTVLLYIASLKTPSSPWFPGTWCFDSIQNLLEKKTGPALIDMALSWSFSLVAGLAMLLAADLFYKKGLSKSLGKKQKTVKGPDNARLLQKKQPSPAMALAIREIRSFMRDQTQWSQVFLVLALIVIYVYNFTLLPLDRSPIKAFYLQNLLSFLNMGLALFVLTAVAGRFAYPAVSMESEAFWIVRSSPVSLSRFLWIKFFVYLVPLFVMAQVLIITTNILLHVTAFMMILSIVTTALVVPAVIALAIGIGSIFADFNLESPLKSVTSFGGMVYMTACAALVALVILLEAGPVYTFFMADIKHRPLAGYEKAWSAVSFVLVPLVCTACVIVPMRLGARYLQQRQQ